MDKVPPIDCSVPSLPCDIFIPVPGARLHFQEEVQEAFPDQEQCLSDACPPAWRKGPGRRKECVVRAKGLSWRECTFHGFLTQTIEILLRKVEQ